MAEVRLPARKYRSPQQLVMDEQRARAMRDEDAGIGLLVYAYCSPGANPFLHGGQIDPSMKRMPGWRAAAAAEIARIWDPQGMVSCARLRDYFMAELFPDGAEWAEIQVGDDFDPDSTPDEDDPKLEADRLAKLEKDRDSIQPELERIQHAAFQALHRSRFSEVAPAALLDAIIWRVGVLVVRQAEEGAPAPIELEHVSAAECSFEWGPDGRCVAVYRRWSLAEHECEALWPKGRGWVFPEGEPDSERHTFETFLVCDYEVPGTNGVWAYQLIQESTKRTCFKAAYTRSRYVVFGVTGAPGDPLTRSIGESLLSTIRTLSALQRITVEGAELRATPIFKSLNNAIQGGLENNRIVPGAVINVNGIDSLQPLDVPSDGGVGDVKTEQLRVQIQEIAHDTDLPRQDQPQPRTAFEIQQQLAKVRRSKGPMAGRLMRYLGVPVLQHVVDALFARREIKGRNAEARETVPVELDGRYARVSWTNPLAHLQRMRDVESAFSFVGQCNEVFPPEQVQGVVAADEFMRGTAKDLRVPERYLRPKKQAQDLSMQAAQAAAMGAGGAAGNPQRAEQQRSTMAQAPMAGGPA